MDKTIIMRRALWATAAWNCGGALSFFFPESIGRLAGFPLPVSPFYTWFIAGVILIFGGAYAWMARQPRIPRSLIVVGALGKCAFFLAALLSWSLGEIPPLTLLGTSGDLIFAAIFVWWLAGEG